MNDEFIENNVPMSKIYIFTSIICTLLGIIIAPQLCEDISQEH